MKPDAPEEIRGEFKPIATTVPGLSFCEHLPMLARQAHHLTLVRSGSASGTGSTRPTTASARTASSAACPTWASASCWPAA
jgi:hypothetical protein